MCVCVRVRVRVCVCVCVITFKMADGGRGSVSHFGTGIAGQMGVNVYRQCMSY